MSAAATADGIARAPHDLRRQRARTFRRHRDAQPPAADDVDAPRLRLDLDLPVAILDVQRDTGLEVRLVPQLLGDDEPAGRVDGNFHGISNGIVTSIGAKRPTLLRRAAPPEPLTRASRSRTA